MMNTYHLPSHILWIPLIFILIMILMLFMHPIVIMLNMVILNILMSLMMSMWKSNYMFSFLLFLIMISGILIIFMYFSSLISNEQSFKSYSSKLSLNLLYMFNMLIMSFNMLSYNYFSPNFINNNFNEIYHFNHIFSNKLMNIQNIYSYPLNNFTLMTIFFIMISFFSIIKINSSSHSYSMRKI